MPLSASDLVLVEELASQASFRDALGLQGPIPKDITPLLESYVAFLRYAPITGAEPSPAVYAVAVAHRQMGPVYDRFCVAYPDLARVAVTSLERTTVFFSDTYRETRHACLRGQPTLDLSIWPIAARDFDKDPPLMSPRELGAVVVLGLVAAALAALGVMSAACVTGLLAIFLFLGLVFRSAFRGMREGIKPDCSTRPISAGIIRAALVQALSAETQTARIGRDRKEAQTDAAVAGTLGFAATLGALASLFDF